MSVVAIALINQWHFSENADFFEYIVYRWAEIAPLTPVISPPWKIASQQYLPWVRVRVWVRMGGGGGIFQGAILLVPVYEYNSQMNMKTDESRRFYSVSVSKANNFRISLLFS